MSGPANGPANGTAFNGVRAGVLGLGVLVGVYGAYLILTRQDTAQLFSAGKWLLGAVVLHDFVLSLAVLAVGLVVTRFVPMVARVPLVVGAVILGTVTVVAVPMLSGNGERADNATLLDRSYGIGWLVLLAIVVVGVVIAIALRARAGAPPPAGARQDDT